MVRELKNRIFLALTLMSVLFLVSGCDSTNNSKNTKYYTGYNSIEMKFLEDTPPTTFYYDSEAEYGSEENTIPINVELYNEGSANSYGALFIHGFDPNIVAVEGYTQGYPGYSGTGAWSSNSFSGWFADGDNYAVSGIGIPIGNSIVNLGLTSIDSRKTISFSSFGFSNRNALFSAMGFSTQASRYSEYSGISTGVIQSSIGSALNPITKGLYNVYGWDGGWLKTFELEGRNSNNPGGGMDVIEFPATITTLPPSLEEFRQRVMVTSCFDYTTHASEMVCIDPEPYSNVKKACTPNTVSLSGGQGAPVSVTTIEQRPAKGRTTFVINIKHTKKDAYDELYNYFSLNKCNPASGETVKLTDKNIVYIGYVYLSDVDITMYCIPDQVIRLDSAGTGQITCSITFPEGMASSAYQAPIEIELWYGYSKTIYRDMIIKRI